ncbi:MAG: class I adenylate-forming enzyme family protein, partial [Steroidobacteraceae bacterium]
LHDLLARNAREHPQAEAVVDPPNLAEIAGDAPQRLSWGAFAQRVEALAGVFLAQGLRRDDVLLVQMTNTHELLAVYLACARLGVIASPVVVQAREHELAAAIDRTQASAILVTARIGRHDHATMARCLALSHSSVRSVLACGNGPLSEGGVDVRQAMAEPLSVQQARQHDLASYEAAHPVSADDAVTILWTSGSEGRAKGVARTHNDWLLYGPHIGDAYAVGTGVRLLSGRPLTTHGAFVGSIVPWLWHAGTLVNHQPFSLPVFLTQLRDEGIGFTALAPAILASLLAQPELLKGIDFQRLRFIGSGSAPLTEALVQGFRERFGVEVINFFGSTEGASLVSSPQDVPEPALRARLFPRFGAEGFDWKHPAHRQVHTRLLDLASGEEIVQPGKVGELRYRGPMVMTGYYRDPELTARAFDDEGYYCSGDLFEIAGEDGRHLRFAGRAKDIIIRGGFNLSAEEIENLVAGHPAVADVAVVGYPDERLGERVCVCVVLRTGHTLELADLVAWLRDERKVAALKWPERLLLMSTLPRNPNNKVIKGELRRLAAEA